MHTFLCYSRPISKSFLHKAAWIGWLNAYLLQSKQKQPQTRQDNANLAGLHLQNPASSPLLDPVVPVFVYFYRWLAHMVNIVGCLLLCCATANWALSVYDFAADIMITS